MKHQKLSFLASFLLAGCTAGVLTYPPSGDIKVDSQAGQMPAARPGGDAAAPVTGTGPVAGNGDRQDTGAAARQPERLTGGIRISVKWPDAPYKLQAIPASTVRINVEVKSADTTVETAVIQRPSQKQAYISGLAVGTYSVVLTGFREDLSTVVASASADVLVKVNEIAGATISMVPSFPPRLDSVEALSNGQLSLKGSNLSFVGAATHSVLINNVPLARSAYTAGTPGDQQIVVTALPDGTTSGLVDVSIDGIKIPVGDKRSFVLGSLSQPVHHIAIAPTAEWSTFPVIKKGENKQLVATLWADENENATTDATIEWDIFKIDPQPLPSESWVSVSGGQVFASDTLTQAATATIRAKAGGQVSQVEVLLEP